MRKCEYWRSREPSLGKIAAKVSEVAERMECGELAPAFNPKDLGKPKMKKRNLSSLALPNLWVRSAGQPDALRTLGRVGGLVARYSLTRGVFSGSIMANNSIADSYYQSVGHAVHLETIG